MPLMAAYIAEMGMMITDMIIVGRLGSNELAAVGLAADWFYVLLLIGMGIISIVGVLVAQSFGEGDMRAVKDSAEQGMIVATICAIPVMLAIWYLGPALRFANQDPDVIRLIGDYSRPLALGVLPALWFVVLRNYVAALRKASGIMTITVLALVVNLAINYTLVFGKFGLPALGVVGAAYGTSIVNWMMFLILAFHVRFSDSFEAFRLSIIPETFQKDRCKEILLLGVTCYRRTNAGRRDVYRCGSNGWHAQCGYSRGPDGHLQRDLFRHERLACPWRCYPVFAWLTGLVRGPLPRPGNLHLSRSASL